MDALTVMLVVGLIVSTVIAVDARLQVAQLRDLQEKDGRYFEWWLRSMENRKIDRETGVQDDAGLTE